MKTAALILFLACAGAAHADMTYLTRGGKLRLEVHAEVIARLKQEGWREAPRPEINPEVHHEPQWRNGRWHVRGMKRSQKPPQGVR